MNQPSRYLLVRADGNSDVSTDEYNYDDLLSHFGDRLYHNEWEAVVEEVDNLDHVGDNILLDIFKERVALIRIE